MINSFISFLLIAVLSLANPLLAVLAIPDLFQKTAEFITTITTSPFWQSFLDYVGFVFYFVPKSTVVMLLGFSVFVLLIRIGLAIVSEVWIG